MRFTGGRVKAGTWCAYEEAYARHVRQSTPIRGLLGRWLVRAIDDPDTGFSVSIWATEQHMDAYERSDCLKREILPNLAPFLTSAFVAHHCEVRFQEIYDPVPPLPGVDVSNPG